MDNMNTLKEQFAREIRRMSLRERREFLNYIKALLADGETSANVRADVDPDPAKDPIFSFIGGISHGTLAENIDEELYGE